MAASYVTICVTHPRGKRYCGKNLSAAAYSCGKSQLGTRDKTAAVGGACPSRHPNEFQKSWGPETKPPRWETLSAVARYLKFENYLSLSHSVQIRIRWDISLRYQGYKQTKVGFIQESWRPGRRKILKTQEKRELGEQEGGFANFLLFFWFILPFSL